jgi:hypothetical protein
LIAKEENLPLLQWIQGHQSSGTDQYFEYIFGVGDKLEFQIRIKGGSFGNSEPDKMLSSLSEYEKLNVQIFECPHSDAWSVNAEPIYPETDERFFSQSWAQNWNLAKSLFGKYSTVSYLMASPDTICDIIRHCQVLAGLKAFW